MKRKLILPLVISALVGLAASAAEQALAQSDRQIGEHAQRMLEEGRRIFRFDTFGSEAFWGDALQMHKAIAGEKNGGVGGGVSPKTALSVGLKVDAEALPAELVAQIKAGKVLSLRNESTYPIVCTPATMWAALMMPHAVTYVSPFA